MTMHEHDATIAIEIADTALKLHGLPTYSEAIKALNALLCMQPGPFGFRFIAEACRVAGGSKS